MIECFFDCSSPWTWLAFRNISVNRLAEVCGALQLSLEDDDGEE